MSCEMYRLFILVVGSYSLFRLVWCRFSSARSFISPSSDRLPTSTATLLGWEQQWTVSCLSPSMGLVSLPLSWHWSLREKQSNLALWETTFVQERGYELDNQLLCYSKGLPFPQKAWLASNGFLVRVCLCMCLGNRDDGCEGVCHYPGDWRSDSHGNRHNPGDFRISVQGSQKWTFSVCWW